MSEFRSAGSMDDAAVPMGDSAFFRLNMRDEPELLEPGELAVSENGRMERRSWQPRKAIKNLSGALQQDGDPLMLPFYLVDLAGGEPIASASRADSVVTVNLTNPLFLEAGSGYLGVEDLTGSVDPNGVRFITVLDPQIFTFVIAGAVGAESYGGTGKARSVLDDSAAAAIRGACVFSDPSSENVESVILAAAGEAYKVSTADGTVETLGYPVGRNFSGPVDVVQSFDQVFIFEKGVRSLALLSGATDFTEVPGGDYSQPQVFAVTGTAVVVSSGLATITVTGNTTVETGDMVRIYGTTDSRFESSVGREFKCTFADADEIKFYIPVADLSTIGAETLSIGKQVSLGLGFSYLPAPEWGVYHQRRLIVPYAYTQETDGDDVVYTARDVTDEIVMSDILDPHTYDVGLNQFVITAGVADFVVGAHPFAEDRLLVFNRNSIHAIDGLSGSLADCTTRELTREVGCVARKSIAQYASQVLFLADNGVYAIGFLDQYNLRPVGEPLSAPIQPLIDRINADLAPFSTGVYFNNRYWLAVPLDSTAGAGDATGNNTILVYNFINGGWESPDTVADSRWKVLALLISRAGQRNDLYAVNDLGGVHRLDAVDSDFDELALAPGGDLEMIRVASRGRTRQYDGGSIERKRFSRVQMQIESAGQAVDADLSLFTEDPDNTVALGTFSGTIGGTLGPNDSASIRPRVGGYRGHGASVEWVPSAGRPKVKSVLVESTTANRTTVSQT